MMEITVLNKIYLESLIENYCLALWSQKLKVLLVPVADKDTITGLTKRQVHVAL